MEAIIAQVRQCPCGALRYLLDDVQQHREREREPITESKDSPYRITGGIPLVGGDPRAEGASTEHYALSWCGGSKNKPFCDGTHGDNHFADPNGWARCSGRRRRR